MTARLPLSRRLGSFSPSRGTIYSTHYDMRNGVWTVRVSVDRLGLQVKRSSMICDIESHVVRVFFSPLFSKLFHNCKMRFIFKWNCLGDGSVSSFIMNCCKTKGKTRRWVPAIASEGREKNSLGSPHFSVTQ